MASHMAGHVAGHMAGHLAGHTVGAGRSSWVMSGLITKSCGLIIQFNELIKWLSVYICVITDAGLITQLARYNHAYIQIVVGMLSSYNYLAFS